LDPRAKLLLGTFYENEQPVFVTSKITYPEKRNCHSISSNTYLVETCSNYEGRYEGKASNFFLLNPALQEAARVTD
jgi:hypothetical protein